MKPIYPWLTYAGTLPFVLGALLLMADVKTVPHLGPVGPVVGAYGLVIATFLAGSHWGQHLGREDKWRFFLPLFSNATALVLWVAFLVLPFAPLLAVFGVALLVLLAIDKKLNDDKVIHADYFRTRSRATAIVLSALVVAGVFA